MKEQIQAKFDEDGVSPVIGVILMVAVTVALVALVTVIVFDIGGDVSESPDATVDIAQDGENVTATVLRNENVEKFKVRTDYTPAGSGTLSDGTTYYHQTDGNGDGDATTSVDYSSAYNASSVGDTVTVHDTLYEDSAPSDSGTPSGSVDETFSISSGDEVQVIAVMSDGSEQVLTTTTYDG